MKSGIKLIEELRNIPESEISTMGISILNKYIDESNNFAPLKTVDIKDRLTPYVSDLVKSFWDTPYTYLGTDEEGQLHSCFIGSYVIKSLEDALNSSVEPSEEHYKEFAEIINKAAEQKLIHSGAICPPSLLRLASITPAARYLFLWYPMTTIKNERLETLNKIFSK